MFGFSNNVSAISIVIEEHVYQELTRSWDNISLLYDDYFHNSSDVDQEIIRFHDLVPDLIDIRFLGKAIKGKISKS